MHFALQILKPDYGSATRQRQLGLTMYGGSYVVNLFKQKVVSQKNDVFTTVTLHNNLFCQGLYDHLHCTNRTFTYVLKKDTLSRKSKRTPFTKKCSQQIITQKQLDSYYLTEGLPWELYNCSVIS